MILPPVIKWPGSKRSLAARLHTLWPTPGPSVRFFEPFVGGGAMLAGRPTVAARAGDTIPELIALWEAVRDVPRTVAAHYERLWHRREGEGHRVFYDVRARFNSRRDPLDLLFLSRTCVNGLIRFNANGDFNNSLHHTRKGIRPETLSRIVLRWSRALTGVQFRCADYRDTLAPARAGDLVFLDPPYAGTAGRYHPRRFSHEELYEELARLNRIGARWILTLDGRAGSREYPVSVPPSLYRHRLGLAAGLSPFTRLMGTSLDGVTESVYLSFDPPPQAIPARSGGALAAGRRGCGRAGRQPGWGMPHLPPRLAAGSADSGQVGPGMARLASRLAHRPPKTRQDGL